MHARWLARSHAEHVWRSVGWILGGAALIGIGLDIWLTAFVLVPLGAIFIIVGTVAGVRGCREGRADSRVARG
jgi:hypothetical protein